MVPVPVTGPAVLVYVHASKSSSSGGDVGARDIIRHFQIPILYIDNPNLSKDTRNSPDLSSSYPRPNCHPHTLPLYIYTVVSRVHVPIEQSSDLHRPPHLFRKVRLYLFPTLGALVPRHVYENAAQKRL